MFEALRQHGHGSRAGGRVGILLGMRAPGKVAQAAAGGHLRSQNPPLVFRQTRMAELGLPLPPVPVLPAAPPEEMGAASPT